MTVPAATAAAQDDGLTVQRTSGTGELSSESFNGNWRADGDAWAISEKDDEGRDELWRVDGGTRSTEGPR